MSEFSCYDFDQLAGYSSQRLQVLFVEATRQRAAKSSLLAMLINKPNQKESDQKEISKHIDKMLNPYKIVNVENVAGDWDLLRSKRRIT